MTVTNKNIELEIGNKASLKRQLLFPYLLISFISTVVISILVYYGYLAKVSAVHQVNEQVSERAGQQIDSYIQSIISEITLTSRIVACVDCGVEINASLLFEKLVIQNPSVIKVMLLDIDKNILSDVSRFTEVDENLEQGLDQKQLQVIAGLAIDDLSISPVYTSKHELPFMKVGVSVVSDEDVTIGYLIADVDLSQMWGTLSRVTVGDTGYAYLSDSHGNLVMYRDLDFVRKNRDISTIPIIKSALKDDYSPKLYASFQGEKVFGDSYAISSTGWIAVVELPESEVLKHFFGLVAMTVLAGFVFMVSTFIMIYLLINKVLKPLDKLKEGALKIEAGNYKHIIEVEVVNELGQLAHTFNEMSNSIRISHDTLEQKVIERTQDLAETQIVLQREMKQVERMNKLMVDRELKMISLKEEIKKLKGE